MWNMSLSDLRSKEFELDDWVITEESREHFQTEYGQWTVVARHNPDWSIPYEGELRHDEDGVKIDIGFHSLQELQGSLITMMHIVDDDAV
jgi:hypothetical protein